MMKNKYLPKYPGPASSRKFSYFEELFKKPPLREWVSSTPGAEDLFVEWVGTNKLDQGVQVRELPSILEDEDAVRVLTAEGIRRRAAIAGGGQSGDYLKTIPTHGGHD